MKTKKSVLLIISCVLLISLISGCGESPKSSTKNTEEPQQTAQTTQAPEIKSALLRVEDKEVTVYYPDNFTSSSTDDGKYYFLNKDGSASITIESVLNTIGNAQDVYDASEYADLQNETITEKGFSFTIQADRENMEYHYVAVGTSFIVSVTMKYSSEQQTEFQNLYQFIDVVFDGNMF